MCNYLNEILSLMEVVVQFICKMILSLIISVYLFQLHFHCLKQLLTRWCLRCSNCVPMYFSILFTVFLPTFLINIAAETDVALAAVVTVAAFAGAGAAAATNDDVRYRLLRRRLLVAILAAFRLIELMMG
ncbi:uncharacterized protein [Rutidosis leptorrhynchoides]|uniref:uncharacterized protein isoform X1 n=1 Tax=Rutidosis leptorrhynchoides TaxID=125765 RepID=UPI003A99E49C